MAKGIFEFDLNEPEDIEAYMRMSKSLGMALALWEFGHNTKKTFEWSMDKYETKEDLLDAVYERFWEILKENDINIDKLIK